MASTSVKVPDMSQSFEVRSQLQATQAPLPACLAASKLQDKTSPPVGQANRGGGDGVNSGCFANCKTLAPAGQGGC